MELLRKIRHRQNGTILTTYDTYKTDRMGRYILRYTFKKDGTILFSGSDFCCSPTHSIDSDEACIALLGFLCLRLGDTDKEYFENYADIQMDWAESSECEYMQVDLCDIENGERPFLAVFDSID